MTDRISFNTGATASNGAPNVASQAITIPAGVLAGDVILFVASGFTNPGGAAETVQASSTGTAPVIIGTTQSVTFNTRVLNSAIFYVIAGASDAGKVITASYVSGDTSEWAIALGAWTGASNSSPIDVSGGATASGNGSSITCPSETTAAGNDWAIQLVGGALGGSSFTGGAGFTQREALSDGASGATGLIYDSNGSVGPAGTGIGGASFSNAGNNSWWAGFTVGLTLRVTPTVLSAAPPMPPGLSSPAAWQFPRYARLGQTVPGMVFGSGGVILPKPSLAGAGNVVGPPGSRMPPPMPPGLLSPAAWQFPQYRRLPSGSGITGTGGVILPKPSLAGAAPTLAAPATPVQGGWWQLDSIIKYARQEREFYATRPPMACPLCGEPMRPAPPSDSGSEVELYCLFDGWQYPRDYHPPPVM